MFLTGGELQAELEKRSPTRDTLIGKAFDQYTKGNDAFLGMSTAEKQSAFATFRSGWLIAEGFCR